MLIAHCCLPWNRRKMRWAPTVWYYASFDVDVYLENWTPKDICVTFSTYFFFKQGITPRKYACILFHPFSLCMCVHGCVFVLCGTLSTNFVYIFAFLFVMLLPLYQLHKILIGTVEYNMSKCCVHVYIWNEDTCCSVVRCAVINWSRMWQHGMPVENVLNWYISVHLCWKSPLCTPGQKHYLVQCYCCIKSGVLA